MLARLILTFFGVGYAPFASGTAASIVALPLAWLIAHYGGPVVLTLAAFAAFGAGVWSCGVYIHESANKDPSECVIDEVAGQWLACAFAPLTLPGFALAFALFRLFDILKPWPVGPAEKAPGGLGVMLDDMVAGLLAGVIVLLLHLAKVI
jgi:phosphatidylglycerophosphatase A